MKVYSLERNAVNLYISIYGRLGIDSDPQGWVKNSEKEYEIYRR